MARRTRSKGPRSAPSPRPACTGRTLVMPSGPRRFSSFASIAPWPSRATTSPLGPTAFARGMVNRPGPQPASRTRMPGARSRRRIRSSGPTTAPTIGFSKRKVRGGGWGIGRRRCRRRPITARSMPPTNAPRNVLPILIPISLPVCPADCPRGPILTVQASERGILGGVVEGCGIHLLRWMSPLPKHGPSQRLFPGELLFVAEFSTDSTRVSEPVLLRVDLPVEVLRQTVLRNAHHFPAPSGGPADLPNPLGPRQGLGLADVVDAAGGALVRHGQRNGRGNVLDVAVGPAPPGHAFSEQYGGTPVVHPLDVVEEPVLIVAGPVYRREPQDGAGQIRISHDGPLDEDLLVLLRTIPLVGAEPLAQGRVLGEWYGVRRPRLQAAHDVVSPVDVLAADRHDPPGDAPEYLHDSPRIPLVHRDHVQDHFWSKACERVCVVPEPAPVARDAHDALRQLPPGPPPVEHGDLVARLGQPPHRVRTYEAGAADDQNFHPRAP